METNTENKKKEFKDVFDKIQLCSRYSDISTAYFEKCFGMLSHRLECDKHKISEIIFTSYLDLPIVISGKIFKAFDEDNDGFLNCSEFVKGMSELYFGSLSKLQKLTFKIFDFKNTKTIVKDDLISLMTYLNSLENILYNIEMHVSEFFGSKSEIDFEEYTNIIQNKNSNMLILFLVYLYKKQSFTEDVLEYFKINFNCTKNETNNSKLYTENEEETNNLIFSPSEEVLYLFKYLFKPFVGVKRKNNHKNVLKFEENLKTVNYDINTSKDSFGDFGETSILLQEKLEIDEPITVFLSNNEIKFFKSSNKSENSSKKFYNMEEKQKFSSYTSSWQLPNRKLVVSNNNQYFDMPVKMSSQLLGFSKTNNELQNSENENNAAPVLINHENQNTIITPTSPSNLPSTTIISENVINIKPLFNSDLKKGYESSVYKLSSNNELSKQKIVIIDKDLFLFRFSFSRNNYILETIEPLSGMFVTVCEETTIAGKSYYGFALLNQYGNIMTHLSNLFFYRKKKEMEKTVTHIKTVLNFREIKNDYELLADIGKGQFGKVKMGINKKNLEKVAIKIIEKKKMKASEIELVRNEIDVMKILKNCPHENIVIPLDFYEDKFHIYIVMEYLRGCTITSFLSNGGLNEELSKVICKQIAQGIKHLHTLGIIHRDIKLDNIIICETKDYINVKLLDFGLSKCLCKTEKTNEGYGTLVFTAPEILSRKPYDLKIDVWSYGILLYYINCKKFPFDGKDLTLNDIGKKICNEEVCFAKCNFSPELEELILFCLNKNPKSRACIEDVIYSDWIS